MQRCVTSGGLWSLWGRSGRTAAASGNERSPQRHFMLPRTWIANSTLVVEVERLSPLTRSEREAVQLPILPAGSDRCRETPHQMKRLLMRSAFCIHLAVAFGCLGFYHGQLAAQTSTFCGTEPIQCDAILLHPVSPANGHDASGIGKMVTQGVALGTGGALVGGMLGAGIGAVLGGGPGFEILGAAGAIAGETALLPLGVHLANDRRGNYTHSLLVASAIAAVGGGLSLWSDSPEVLIAIPVAQLITSITIERKSAPVTAR